MTDKNVMRYFNPDPEFTQISEKDEALRQRIVTIIDRHTKEMEGYSYFGSNPGIARDDYEDVADEIMLELGLTSDLLEQKEQG